MTNKIWRVFKTHYMYIEKLVPSTAVFGDLKIKIPRCALNRASGTGAPLNTFVSYEIGCSYNLAFLTFTSKLYLEC